MPSKGTEYPATNLAAVQQRAVAADGDDQIRPGGERCFRTGQDGAGVKIQSETGIGQGEHPPCRGTWPAKLSMHSATRESLALPTSAMD